MFHFLIINKNNYNVFANTIVRKTFKRYYLYYYFLNSLKWNSTFYKIKKKSEMGKYKNIKNFFFFGKYKLKRLWNLFMYKLYFSNSWKFYRQAFGLSVFSKTRTNSSSIKNQKPIVLNFLLKKIHKRRFRKFFGKDKLLILHMEILNKLWFFQWHWEWEFAQFKFFEFKETTTKRKKFKIGVYFSKKNKGLNFIPRPQKKNKKKIVIPQDNFNIGFYFNFTRKFKGQITAGKAVKDGNKKQ